jgi:hypothetical protein
MHKKYASIFLSAWLLLLAHFPLPAQERVTSFEPLVIPLEIQATLNNERLVLGKMVFIPILNDSVQINRLRFYLSDISVSNSSVNQENMGERFLLIDLETPSSLKRQLSLKKDHKWDSIHFKIGVDSAIQMKGAQAGDLDPVHGMYWSWRSGYINFKCEGSSPICPARKKEFLFHIGGFQAPFNTIQSVTLPLHSDTIVIQIDLTPLFTDSNVKQSYQVMSPSAKAVNFANQLPSLFRSIP